MNAKNLNNILIQAQYILFNFMKDGYTYWRICDV
ncbi:MAG: hypothetical protein Hyperionvirus1_9 [Hyperionvirus sp.]|uniref:Uncharacterized protein n=1 Tax=Hyperionvirus sp. TaxID=2487770 RepID=A0A3G5A5A3_9VIRU|nr:MAG: hypothetical protein Hyperionvirus1_9 [Hyperionvirus sp.]